MTERRLSPRLRTYKGGTIEFGAAPSIPCMIRNLSQTGACIEVKEHLPDEFTLLIRPEILKRRCRIVWRAEGKVGVVFQ